MFLRTFLFLSVFLCAANIKNISLGFLAGSFLPNSNISGPSLQNSLLWDASLPHGLSVASDARTLPPMSGSSSHPPADRERHTHGNALFDVASAGLEEARTNHGGDVRTTDTHEKPSLRGSELSGESSLTEQQLEVFPAKNVF
jgi:hypothetical protein